jgi:dCTP deaminase
VEYRDAKIFPDAHFSPRNSPLRGAWRPVVAAGGWAARFFIGNCQVMPVRWSRSFLIRKNTRLNMGLTRNRKRIGMTIQSDRWIREQAIQHRMIEPFSEKQVASGVISYGLSSYGYDLRVSDEFKIFTNVNSAIIDPKAFDERSFVTVQADSVIVPPNSFALARSVEYFRIPRDVLTICVGKSTYARCGIIVNVTPFEPEWEGFVTLEISNTTPLPAKIYANEGLCQILFFRSDEPCQVSYADRKGKYQKQQGIVLPKL